MNNEAKYQERKKNALYEKTGIWQDRISELLVLAVICIHPLYLNPDRDIGRYVNLTQHKFIFFAIVMAVIIAAIVLLWAFRLTRKPRLLPQNRSMSVSDWAILFFVAAALLSALFSPFKGEADVWLGRSERYDGIAAQFLYIAVYFIVSRWYKPRERDFFLFGISAVIVALIGIFQFYGMDIFTLWPNHRADKYVENFYHIPFRSTLGNVDIVSSYVCVAVLLCGFLFVRVKSKWWPVWLVGSALNFWLMELADADSGRVGLLVTVVLAIPFIVDNVKILGRFLVLGASWITVYILQMLFYDIIILETRTAGSLLPYIAVLCVSLVLGIFLWLRGKNPEPNAPVKWKLGVILIVGCIVVALMGVEVLGKRGSPEEPSNQIYQLREILHGNAQDDFATYRIHIWRNALDVFPKYPILGSGPDTFASIFPAEAQGIVGEFYDKAHNEYLQILVCQGILGLLSYLVFLGEILYKPVAKAFKNPMLMAVLAAFSGYCIQAFFNISVPIVAPLLWVFAGMLASKKFREMAVS